MSTLTLVTLVSLRWATVLPLLGGAAVAAGLLMVVGGLAPRPVRLADVLGTSGGRGSPAAGRPLVNPGSADDGLLDRVGLKLWSVIPVGHRTAATLQMQGRTGADFMAEKLVVAVIGAAAPGLVSLLTWLMGTSFGAMPALWVLVGAAVGWFIPDLLLLRSRGRFQNAAGEAVFTYIDLVTLERLANQSATASLTRAASLSDNVLFRELRTALERARLEQRPAWQALDEVAERLDLAPLHDIADVMRLDEQGAALGGALRARVRELRDGHLMSQKIEAQRTSESLTIWMVIPALVFGLILLTPPLLTMLNG
ncbi:type II secretion system F family protein [Propionibacteriaceae bacterium G1746]|uniref:type II secretion system F family protein n=1 Tax=Aestuariimicrobium sp. G57 TaxID=3418485 RepID=UPI003C17CA71